ncbi:MAG: prepilin-type N-terminal cleavage/methylation domain-containing protein [Deltaproteobacteria bacterium]|nr:prepilin-type N-terminal cleavage/methylation domain-containing protein [Deltaproteobacteria bacterium]
MNSTKPTNTAGFTLLEILIAIFIFAAILSTIFTSYTGTFRVMENTESQANIYAMARIAMERMTQDLESACLPKEVKTHEPGGGTSQTFQFVGEHNEIEGRDADSLRFTSLAHLSFADEDKACGPAEISFYVKENEEESSFVLYRTDTPVFRESPEKGTGGFELCNGLTSVKFTYYDSDGQPHDSWDSTSNEFKGNIPRRVSIMLQFVNTLHPEEPFTFMTATTLPVSKG